MIFFSPGRVISCISLLHCSATLLMYHHPTSEKMSMFYKTHRKKTCPNKKTRSSDMFFQRPKFGLYVFSEFNLHQSLPLPNHAEVGDGDMEPWASWPGCRNLESRKNPVKYDVNHEKSHSDVIDLQMVFRYFIVNCYYLLILKSLRCMCQDFARFACKSFPKLTGF